MDIPGVKGTEKCFVRKAGMAYNVELHVLVDANLTVAQGHDIAHDLKDYLMGRLTDLGHILIHIEPC
jgi:divalent metal cation (Fe/Co/Zn/Cd) transporter